MSGSRPPLGPPFQTSLGLAAARLVRPLLGGLGWISALLLFGVPGCVMRYGEAPRSAADVAAERVDLAPIEAKIEAMIEVETQLDRRDNLEAARALSRDLKTADASAQAALRVYLEALVQIMERDEPVPLEASEVVDGGVAFDSPNAVEVGAAELSDAPAAPAGGEAAPAEPPVEGPVVGPVEGPIVTPVDAPVQALSDASVQAPVEGPSSDAEPPPAEPPITRPPGEVLALARAHLKANELEQALALLESCPQRSCGNAGVRLHAELCTAWTLGERRVTTRQHEAASREPDPTARDALLRQVESDLVEVIRRCPETATGARNQLDRVRAERVSSAAGHP